MVKNYEAANVEIFNDKDNNADDRKEEVKKESKDDMEVPTTDSYFTCKCNYMYSLAKIRCN